MVRFPFQYYRARRGFLKPFMDHVRRVVYPGNSDNTGVIDQQASLESPREKLSPQITDLTRFPETTGGVQSSTLVYSTRMEVGE